MVLHTDMAGLVGVMLGCVGSYVEWPEHILAWIILYSFECNPIVILFPRTVSLSNLW